MLKVLGLEEWTEDCSYDDGWFLVVNRHKVTKLGEFVAQDKFWDLQQYWYCKGRWDYKPASGFSFTELRNKARKVLLQRREDMMFSRLLSALGIEEGKGIGTFCGYRRTASDLARQIQMVKKSHPKFRRLGLNDYTSIREVVILELHDCVYHGSLIGSSLPSFLKRMGKTPQDITAVYTKNVTYVRPRYEELV